MLFRSIRSNEKLNKFSNNLYWHCRNISRKLALLAKKITAQSRDAADPVVIADLGVKGCAFVFKGINLRISHQHLSKLRELYQGSTNFNNDVFCLLLRYKALHGGGFQASLPACVFDVLKREFGVEMEGFASPLNSRFSCFCSAFPDTDAVFGSLGSFFEFCPRSGSFALNPPFVGDLILHAAEHCERLLRVANDARRPLSFVIVVGASEAAREQKAWARLCAGEFRAMPDPLLFKVLCPPIIASASTFGAPNDTGMISFHAGNRAPLYRRAAALRTRGISTHL